MNFSANIIIFSVNIYFENHILDIFFEPMDVSGAK